MTLEDPISRFLDLEKQTTSVLEELEKLQQETRHYSAAGEGLDNAVNQFTAVSEKLIGLTQGLHEMIETLKNIGTPELLANSQKVHEKVKILTSEVQTLREETADQLKIITDYERRGFFAKLFGSGPALKQ